MRKIIALLLALPFVLSLASCRGTEVVTDVPDDFGIYMEWGCGGDSTYDSQTGKLVKQNIATDVDAYTTTFFLSDAQKTELYRLITEMQPETYPDKYNPIKGMSAPSRTIVLSVTYNGTTKTIACGNVSLGNEPDGRQGKRFMAVHDALVGFVTQSEEWRALPEYEFLYD